jgi:hypothetical protein
MRLELQGAEGDVDTWYVQAAGKVWGPYAYARVETFVAEGRVAAETLMAPDQAGPFRPAARQARLHRLFGDVELAPGEALQPAAARPAAETGPVRPLLVWAALKGQKPDRFEQLLAAHGPFVRVGPGLWLVRAPLAPASLRNVMTRRLEAGDSIMVMEAPLDRAAWFNLDGETDRTLRQLWADKSG